MRRGHALVHPLEGGGELGRRHRRAPAGPGLGQARPRSPETSVGPLCTSGVRGAALPDWVATVRLECGHYGRAGSWRATERSDRQVKHLADGLHERRTGACAWSSAQDLFAVERRLETKSTWSSGCFAVPAMPALLAALLGVLPDRRPAGGAAAPGPKAVERRHLRRLLLVHAAGVPRGAGCPRPSRPDTPAAPGRSRRTEARGDRPYWSRGTGGG